MLIVGLSENPTQTAVFDSLELTSTFVQSTAPLLIACWIHDVTFQLTFWFGVRLVVVNAADTLLLLHVGWFAHVVDVPIGPLECITTVCAVDAATAAFVASSVNVAEETVAPFSWPGIVIR